MDKARLKLGAVPVRVAAKVYGRDPAWVRAGIIAGWLPIGEATRNGRRVTDLKEMSSKIRENQLLYFAEASFRADRLRMEGRRMKRERAQLSTKNPCSIPKHRYYELKHFCLQYPDWKKALVLLDGWNTEPRGIPGIIKGRPPESPTERQAIARLYYSGQIAIVDRCIEKLDPTLAHFILKGVTEGIGFEKLQAQGCPCCREMYYEYYRYFFWLLSKERQ